MTTEQKNKDNNAQLVSPLSARLREGAVICMGTLAVFLLLALITYHPQDPGWSYTGSGDVIHNSAGRAGAWLADVFLQLFGYLAYVFPFMVSYLAYLVFRERKLIERHDWHYWALRGAGFILTLLAGTAIAALNFEDPIIQPSYTSGGVFGQMFGDFLFAAFNALGTTLVLLALFLTGFTLFTGLSWFRLMDVIGAKVIGGIEWVQLKLAERREQKTEEKEVKIKKETRQKAIAEAQVKRETRQPIRIEPVVSKIEPSTRAVKEKQQKLFDEPVEGELPNMNLLDEPQPAKHQISEESLEAMSRLVELKLADFGVQAQVVAVNPGPVITRYELDLAPGVKVSKITALAKDLARALASVSVRVVEVIPGKPYIGIELPNEHREMVRLKEVVGSKEFDNSRSNLSMALGKDISGNPVVIDLAKMPHLLVAGTTGSGKSVGLNAMLVSILYKSTPEDVRFIMIDPKMLELSVYDGIPHLLAPVVTDVKESANALRWSVAEMERRYRLMAAMGVRNLAGFNRKIKDAIKAGQPLTDPLWTNTDDMSDHPPELTTLPQIVIVIDELADMMMIVGKKVEELIARIAQKARAAGIHLILATQRPSVDVITGLIKANVPSRIAFQVSSRIDSRTILDQMGAEHLLGQGDMLYLPAGKNIPERVHGAFVDDDEVHRVVADWQKRGEPDFEEAITSGVSETEMMGIPKGSDEEASAERDELYDQAVAIVTESRRASISGIQRRLKIGYNRAARMIEEMEAAGVVSEMQSNGMREVLAPPPPK
ncbi:DNA translocase FtsK [Pleionea litopenaei]|uniref:DNA translocase FtsK n=1 Tax=Pleionea litopenaei TaxID=3070815 RepID=A0AA51X7P4_9GAMM|nr:DNA translocase FtsK 4TM domain-containing protein [Pleionea sp. HL-JVS1]WMS88091.1 DNA translocase FtsK 4TM domain-containing protein [Pleionea sp. HL-JVS1]